MTILHVYSLSFLNYIYLFFLFILGPHLPLQIPDVGHAGMCCHDGNFLHHKPGIDYLSTKSFSTWYSIADYRWMDSFRWCMCYVLYVNRWMRVTGTGEGTLFRWTAPSSLESMACGTSMCLPLCSSMRHLINAMGMSSQVVRLLKSKMHSQNQFHVSSTKKSVPAVLQRHWLSTMLYSLLVFGLF